ncbi:hypothetical protein [Chitinophaga solisilvae]|uniref:hypothetical protein n=1 Tax=Chitinophaga solisilvae TaxID=1233460 RepID=UPI001370CD48|nr:hypothetical protein [Chitinophaga solisilvae]
MKNIFRKGRLWLPLCVIPAIMLACHGDGKKNGNNKNGKDSGQVTTTVDVPALSTEAYVAGIISRRADIARQLPGIKAAAAADLYHALALYTDTALAAISGNETSWLDEYANYYSDEQKAVVPPAKAALRIKLLATAGIEPWNIGEGYTELRTEPAFYTGLFKSSLPADYNSFLQLQADEDTVLYSADAGLVISFNQVGKRVLNWEKFLDTYPGSIFTAAARELYAGYTLDYLFGEDNTPAFDRHEDLSSLYPENKQEYLSFVQQHGDTRTGTVVKRFLQQVSTGITYGELRHDIQNTIGILCAGEVSLAPVQPDFHAAAIEKLTAPVYDTVPSTIDIAEGASEKINRKLDSIMYFQQDGQLYCVAIFTNSGSSGGAPVSGWVDVWAFRKTADRWQTASYLLNAGGGGMYGNSGYFHKLVNMGAHTTGIVISGGITHMGSSVSWDDMIAFTGEELRPVMNIVTDDSYDGGTGNSKCRNCKWLLQPAAGRENYDLVIISGSCLRGNTPLKRILVPYSKSGYQVPEEFMDKGI